MRSMLVCVTAAFAVVLTPHVADASTGTPPDSTVPPGDDAGNDDPGEVSGGDEPGEPPTELPLIPVPTGCNTPLMPHVVFVGEVVDADYRTVRFEIGRIRSGQSAPFADGGLIDVRYGIDAQYLSDGEDYLVSAVVDPDLGLLVSRVTEPVENFGGDDVIGVSESDVNCPDFEDPMRTLELDGSPVDSSVIGPFTSARVQLLGAVLLPFGVAFGVIFLLATLRLSVSGLYRSVTDTDRRT